MPNRTTQQVIVGIVAMTWLAIALLTGQTLSPTPLRLYSIAGSIVFLAMLAYEHYIWRWRIVRRFTGVPLVAGTWRGSLVSSYVDASGVSKAPVPAAIRVTQTASVVTVTLFTEDSTSNSKYVQLAELPDSRWRLTWSYVNNPRSGVRDRSGPHNGSAEAILGGNGASLDGEYFTDRLTRGELHFTTWSPTKYSTAHAAFQATDFISPNPYVVGSP